MIEKVKNRSDPLDGICGPATETHNEQILIERKNTMEKRDPQTDEFIALIGEKNWREAFRRTVNNSELCRLYMEEQCSQAAGNDTHYYIYCGEYIKTEIGFLILELKPWHYIDAGGKPCYLIPVTLHCNDTCGDVRQRFCVSANESEGIRVSKADVAIDFERLYTPYNMEIRIYGEKPMPRKELNIDIGYSICGHNRMRALILALETFCN